MNEPTLVILTPGFPANEDDSTCLPMQQSFVRKLRELYPGLNLIILSSQYPFQHSTYSWDGIMVISFGGKNRGGLARLMLRRKLNKKLEQIRKKNNIIGILSFWCNECALIGKRFAGKSGIKHYCWILGRDAQKQNRYVKKIKPDPGELLALSDFVKEEFRKNHDIQPAYTIPPGIDIQQFGNTVLIKDIDILGAGSLIPLKQYEVFLAIIHAIKMHLPGVKAILCGTGPEKEKLEQLLVKLDLQDTVTLAGELPHVEVLELMKRTKVFLHTSAYEGFGVVCLEALYGGARVISFCKPMQKEIKNWYIVDSKRSMEENALTLLESSLVHERVLVYSMEETANKIMRLFGSVLN